MNDLIDSDPILLRLEEQITWYDETSLKNQKRFAAALIPS